jgi:hypothetical protein
MEGRRYAHTRGFECSIERKVSAIEVEAMSYAVPRRSLMSLKVDTAFCLKPAVGLEQRLGRIRERFREAFERNSDQDEGDDLAVRPVL